MKPDKFEPTLIKRTDDYVYYEFQSPTFGFIDDVRCCRSTIRIALRATRFDPTSDCDECLPLLPKIAS